MSAIAPRRRKPGRADTPATHRTFAPPRPPLHLLHDPPPTNLDGPPHAAVPHDPPPSDVLHDQPPADVLRDPSPADVLHDAPPAAVPYDQPPTDVLHGAPPAAVPYDQPPTDAPHGPPPAGVLHCPPPADALHDLDALVLGQAAAAEVGRHDDGPLAATDERPPAVPPRGAVAPAQAVPVAGDHTGRSPAVALSPEAQDRTGAATSAAVDPMPRASAAVRADLGMPTLDDAPAPSAGGRVGEPSAVGALDVGWPATGPARRSAALVGVVSGPATLGAALGGVAAQERAAGVRVVVVAAPGAGPAGPAAPALPRASTLARRLRASGFAASPSGATCRVRLPEDPAVAAAEAARLVAAVQDATVLLGVSERHPELDALLADADRLVLAMPSAADPALLALAWDSLSRLGPPVEGRRVPGDPLGRLAAAAGMRGLAVLDRPTQAPSA